MNVRRQFLLSLLAASLFPNWEVRKDFRQMSAKQSRDSWMPLHGKKSQ